MLSRPALLPAVVCLALAVSALAQQPATTDSSHTLFAVMAAVNAAGYDADLNSPHNHPVRAAVRREIAAANVPSLTALRTFYAAHRNPNTARDLGQWISFALLIGEPPEFKFRVREGDLPPEVAALKEFRPLVAAFYKEASLDKLWAKYESEYDRELQRYDDGLARVMLEVNGYLRLPTSGFLGRNFTVHVDLLGAPRQVNARSFGPDYFVVASAAPEPQIDEIRHGYLHYVLDAMTGKYNALVRSKNILHAFADEAHALDPVLRKDFRLLLTESLIRAAELRMSRGSPIAKQQRLRDMMIEGHFLTPYFFEALEKFEKQEAGMRIYLPEMIEKIDVGDEQKRLAKVTFRTPSMVTGGGGAHVVSLAPVETPAPAVSATTAAGAAASSSPTAAGGTTISAGTSEEERLIAQGEDALARKDFAEARRVFELAADRKGALQAQAVYGLALVATQERRPELAKTYFQQTLELSKDQRLVAWAHIYLGRIFDMEQNRDLAIKHYEQALAAGNSEPATRMAAERGLQAPFRRAAPGNEKPRQQ